MKSCICFCLMLFFTGGLFGQRLLGRVTDVKTLKPLTGVHVFIKSLKKGVTTKKDGIFYFEQVQGLSQQDTLIFNHVGYHTLQITLKEFKDQQNSISLAEENLKHIEKSGNSIRILTGDSGDSR